MELMIVALILFAALVVCWLVLPGGAAVIELKHEAEPSIQSTVRQPA